MEVHHFDSKAHRFVCAQKVQFRWMREDCFKANDAGILQKSKSFLLCNQSSSITMLFRRLRPECLGNIIRFYIRQISARQESFIKGRLTSPIAADQYP